MGEGHVRRHGHDHEMLNVHGVGPPLKVGTSTQVGTQVGTGGYLHTHIT